MTKQKEYLDYLRNRKYDEWFPFELISKRLVILSEFCTVINNHPEELSPALQAIIKKWGIKPSESLMDYFLLDIRNFYWVAFKKFKKTIEYPKSSEIVIDFRNKIISHLTVDNPKELIEWYEKVNEFGFDKIISEYEEFREYIRMKIMGTLPTS